MVNPYQVLGVSQDVSDEEIKKAYRSLSRQYHPDANIDSSDKEQSEEKFKQIQQAYQQIMKERTEGSSQSGTQSGYGQPGYGAQGSPFGSYGGENEDPFKNFQDFFGGFGYGGNQQRGGQFSEEDEKDSHLKAAANYNAGGYYQEARNVLDDMSERGARWYFHSARAHQGVGNQVAALQDAKKAAAMEPTNVEYQNLIRMVESGSNWYQQRQSVYESPFGGSSSFCLKLCIANIVCNVCFGGGGMCCV